MTWRSVAVLQDKSTGNILKDSDWGGLLIEADPERAGRLSQLYQHQPLVHCVCTYVELLGEASLTAILKKHEAPHEPCLLSIDVDGADYHVWDGLDALYKPRIVVIE